MNIDLLRELALLEEKYAREIKELSQKINHIVLKTLFEGVAKDSEKHAVIYFSVYRLLSEPSPFISEADFKVIAEVIDRHIKTESLMIEQSKSIVASSSDPRVKLLVSAIVDDEAKHHALLLSIKKWILELETLREDIIWDMIWKDSPWHGTPGG